MKLRYIIVFVLLLILAVILALQYGNASSLEAFLWGEPGSVVMTAGIFGFVKRFVGGNIKSVVRAIGSKVGLGTTSGKTIQITTKTDPEVAARAARQAETLDKLLTLQVDQAKAKQSGNFLTMKVLGVPLVGVLAVGGLAIGAIFILRKKG